MAATKSLATKVPPAGGSVGGGAGGRRELMWVTELTVRSMNRVQFAR
jgi:hypothetical protein